MAFVEDTQGAAAGRNAAGAACVTPSPRRSVPNIA
jgi:hypothetical protein